MLSGASHARLRDSSPVSNVRRPKKWHSELIEYVTWCSTSMRIRPPHSMPVRPSTSRPPMAKPRTNGSTSPTVTHRTKVRSTHDTTGSFMRSGA